MEPSQWQEWLLSPRRDGWPARIGELLPGGLAESCLAIYNDPDARHPLDATGFPCRETFGRLSNALSTASHAEWMVGYWDGWSAIESSLREAYGDRLFRLQVPLRGYLAVHAGLDEITDFHRSQRPFVGPSLMAASDRSVLAVGDVDWPVTYVGFTSAALRQSVARTLESDGVPVDTTCNPLAPLPGYILPHVQSDGAGPRDPAQ